MAFDWCVFIMCVGCTDTTHALRLCGRRCRAWRPRLARARALPRPNHNMISPVWEGCGTRHTIIGIDRITRLPRRRQRPPQHRTLTSIRIISLGTNRRAMAACPATPHTVRVCHHRH